MSRSRSIWTNSSRLSVPSKTSGSRSSKSPRRIMDKVRQLSVLLVEDDFGDAALVEIFLHEAWASNPPRVTHVARLADARTQLTTEDFDVVLCDLSLPDAEGMDTVLELRASSSGAPIVVL